jgi:nucleotide-binding universal stress UspA family protein
MSEIIVGLDLSPSARAALDWGAEQARATGQTLRAVHVINASSTYSMALGGVAVPIEPSEMDSARREALEAVFDAVQPELGWRLKFFSGEAGPILVAESVGAALLVVGTKEHVGIGRLISGSVSHYCLSHANCPVVAVPAARDHGTKKDHDHTAAETPDSYRAAPQPNPVFHDAPPST